MADIAKAILVEAGNASASSLILERTTVHVNNDTGHIAMLEKRISGTDGSASSLYPDPVTVHRLLYFMKKLRSKLLVLIAQLQKINLSENLIIEVEKLNEHYEYGVALDFIVSYIEDNDVQINPEIYNCIVDLAKEMHLPEEDYTHIKKLIF